MKDPFAQDKAIAARVVETMRAAGPGQEIFVWIVGAMRWREWLLPILGEACSPEDGFSAGSNSAWICGRELRLMAPGDAVLGYACIFVNEFEEIAAFIGRSGGAAAEQKARLWWNVAQCRRPVPRSEGRGDG